MDWVKPFYTKQHEWLGGYYLGAVLDQHREQAATIVRLAGAPPRRVLELGAGGGQSAAAAADLGYDVVAVELLPAAAAHAAALARQPRAGTLTAIQADFYDVARDGSFDVVCYRDGFGVGTDADQARLLQRVREWLAPGGCALIEVLTPWYWAQAAGREMRFDNVMRRYGFDAEGCRMLDRWWPLADPAQAVGQSLRCYSPADLRLLLRETGLSLDAVEPGGAVISYDPVRFVSPVPLAGAMGYVAKLMIA